MKTSWWLNQHNLKNMVVKLDHETPGIGVKIKNNLWNNHLENPAAKIPQ